MDPVSRELGRTYGTRDLKIGAKYAMLAMLAGAAGAVPGVLIVRDANATFNNDPRVIAYDQAVNRSGSVRLVGDTAYIASLERLEALHAQMKAAEDETNPERRLGFGLLAVGALVGAGAAMEAGRRARFSNIADMIRNR